MRPNLPNHEVAKEDYMHEDGTFFRNPTHLKMAERAIDQSEIVKSIRGMNKERQTQRILFNDKDNLQFPGVLKIRDLTEEQLTGLFKSILRSRPNIYMLRISLGEYPGLRKISDKKILQVGSTRPIYQTELAERIAEVFADPRLRIADFVYYVNQQGEGTFSSTAEAYTTTEEEYNNDALFQPVLEFEYFGE